MKKQLTSAAFGLAAAAAMSANAGNAHLPPSPAESPLGQRIGPLGVGGSTQTNGLLLELMEIL